MLMKLQHSGNNRRMLLTESHADGADVDEEAFRPFLRSVSK